MNATLRTPLPRVAVLALAASALGHGTGRAQTVFRNVDILDVTTATITEDQSIVVEDGMISSIRPADEVPPVPGEIDGEGLLAMPGLVDMHVHLEWFPSPEVLPLFLRYGVTTVRQMDGRPAHLGWRDQVASGQLVGPFIVAGGQILEGSDPLWDDTRVVTTEAEARAAVREQADEGYDFIKTYHTLPPPLYRAILEQAGDLGLPVAGHIPLGVGLDELLAGSQASVEHLHSFTRFLTRPDLEVPAGLENVACRYMAVPLDPDRVAAFIHAVAASDLAITPTVSIQEQFLRALRSESPVVPHARFLTEDVRDFWFGVHGGQYEALDDQTIGLGWEGLARKKGLLARLHAAGVPLFIGTDTPQPFLVPGLSLLQEMDAFVDAGIPPADVLRLATQAPARFLDALQGSGAVREGSRANFILLDSDPLADLSTLRRVQGVMLGARWVSRDELHRLTDP